MISTKIIDAFNITGKPQLLEGGQGNSYKVGDTILKKNDGDNENYEITARILSELSSPYYRITKPVLSRNGNYIEDSYIATHFEEGHHDFDRIEETIALSRLFHKDIKRYDISILKQVNNQWAIAMDILFRNREIPDYAAKDCVEICLKMMSYLKDIDEPLQIIHGDFGGNVLYSDSLPPCIIDFSPNIAPAKMSEAIIVADAIAWQNKDFDIIELLYPYSDYKDYLLYAVMFRILTAVSKIGETKDEFFKEYDAYIKIWDYLMSK